MSDVVGQLRSFNRYYTQRLGLLTDRYLGQDRPLAQARLLFEIGSEGAVVRDLRRSLGLDSGYLSRLLRSLERAGLVETAAGDADGRVRVVTPTPAGLAELAEMNRRADAHARQLIEHLDPGEQEELLAALGTVERLLHR